METPNFNKKEAELLKATALKVRQANTRAIRIVATLLEPNIDEAYFLEQLAYITKSHYEDVVEERYVLLLCGYPLCDQQLEKVPHQKYHIAVAKKKVYDITERKKYCSGFCFKSSEAIKEQIPTSPLHLRDKEKIPNFKLLPRSNKSDCVKNAKLTVNDKQ